MPFTKPPAGSSFDGGDDITFEDTPPVTVVDELKKAAEAIGGTVDDEVVDQQVEEEEQDDIPVADKQAYIRSMLAKERFTKSYELFGGALHVTLQNRLVSENELIKTKEDLTGAYKLACSIKEIVAETGDKYLVSADLVSGGDCSVDPLLDMDDILYAALLRAFHEFEELCDILFRRASSPDFWIKIAGAI